MIGELRGKTALITGAGSGIGLGMARAFAEAGLKIAMVDIDAKALSAAATDLTASGAQVLALPLDVTDYPGWTAAADTVEAALGPVQILCNNAGVGAMGLTLDVLTPEVWNKFVSINLNGVFYGIHCLVPRMRAAGDGHIVNTASMAGLMSGHAGIAPYATTKHAVVGLSETLRAELAPQGIGVSVLCPAAVRTQLWRTSRRVRDLPDIEIPPPEYRLGSASPDGLDPYRVGLRVLEAIRANELYILTHPETRNWVVPRFAAIMAAYDTAEAALPTLRGEPKGK